MKRKLKTKEAVRKAYGKIAIDGSRCGCAGCGPEDTAEFAQSIGYSKTELDHIPAESNLGLSCGNPTAIGQLKPGEVVLDLGSGAGFDCFLAAVKVGPTGKVFGVDMTPEMIDRARENSAKTGVENVEFRLGDIENLPVADHTIDVVISNCVINLSVDKPRVFREIRRILKPGGRIAISDIALTRELPEETRDSLEAYIGCVAGAIHVEDYKQIVQSAGFKDVEVTIYSEAGCGEPDDGAVSIAVSGKK